MFFYERKLLKYSYSHIKLCKYLSLFHNQFVIANVLFSTNKIKRIDRCRPLTVANRLDSNFVAMMYIKMCIKSDIC